MNQVHTPKTIVKRLNKTQRLFVYWQYILFLKFRTVSLTPNFINYAVVNKMVNPTVQRFPTIKISQLGRDSLKDQCYNSIDY